MTFEDIFLRISWYKSSVVYRCVYMIPCIAFLFRVKLHYNTNCCMVRAFCIAAV